MPRKFMLYFENSFLLKEIKEKKYLKHSTTNKILTNIKNQLNQLPKQNCLQYMTIT